MDNDEADIEEPAVQGAGVDDPGGGADATWDRPYCFRRKRAPPTTLYEISMKAVLSRYIPYIPSHAVSLVLRISSSEIINSLHYKL